MYPLIPPRFFDEFSKNIHLDGKLDIVCALQSLSWACSTPQKKQFEIYHRYVLARRSNNYCNVK
jgi:hypothetical protein